MGTATDAELGFVPPKSVDTDDVDRKTFLTTTLGASAGMLVPTTGEHAIDPEQLTNSLAGSTSSYRRMESAVSSQELAPTVAAHLRLATSLVTERLRTSSGYAALSEIAGLAGWLAANRADHAQARTHYAEAVRWAQRTRHPLLTAYMTASFGQYATETGDANQGLHLLETARNQLDPSAPATAHAWLSSLRAIAHATNGDHRQTNAALREAEYHAHRRAETHWPWAFVFDDAKLARHQFTALARIGENRAANRAFNEAEPALTGPNHEH